MFFPKGVNVKGTDFIAGEVNEVEETPGSIDRWLIRGCTIVEDEPKKEVKEEKKEEVVVEEIVVEEKVEKKPVKTKSNKKSKK